MRRRRPPQASPLPQAQPLAAHSSLAAHPVASEQQRGLYASRGYIVVAGLISHDELVGLSRNIDSILDGNLRPSLPWRGNQPPEHFPLAWEPGKNDREDIPRRDRIRFIFGMARHDPFFRAFNRSSKLCGMMASLFESSGVQNLFGDQVFAKPPNGVEAAMHQDTAFWPRTVPNAMNLWVAIDPATIENGCLYVIPGSHRSELPHHDDPIQSHILDDSKVDMTQLQPIEMKPGDTLFMDSGLVHRSYTNRSAHRRRAIGCVFGSSDMKLVGECWRSEPYLERQADFEPIECNA